MPKKLTKAQRAFMLDIINDINDEAYAYAAYGEFLDFELIADTVASVHLHWLSTENEREVRTRFAEEFARRLNITNPRFDCAKFLKACGAT